MKGVIPEAEEQTSDIENSMLQGSLRALRAGERGIILGRDWLILYAYFPEML